MKKVVKPDLKSLLLKVSKGKKYNAAQFKAGFKVEHEHADVTKDDPVKTAKIVIAHLKEVPNYYTKLKKVEGSAMKKAPKMKYDKEEKKEGPKHEKMEKIIKKQEKKSKKPAKKA